MMLKAKSWDHLRNVERGKKKKGKKEGAEFLRFRCWVGGGREERARQTEKEQWGRGEESQTSLRVPSVSRRKGSTVFMLLRLGKMRKEPCELLGWATGGSLTTIRAISATQWRQKLKHVEERMEVRGGDVKTEEPSFEKIYCEEW